MQDKRLYIVSAELMSLSTTIFLFQHQLMVRQSLLLIYQDIVGIRRFCVFMAGEQYLGTDPLQYVTLKMCNSWLHIQELNYVGKPLFLTCNFT